MMVKMQMHMMITIVDMTIDNNDVDHDMMMMVELPRVLATIDE